MGELDSPDELRAALSDVHRLRWWTVAVLFGVALVALAALGTLVEHDQARLAANCALNSDIAGLPLMVNPATHTVSKLAVTLIIDARAAYTRAECHPGGLPPVSPTLAHWAAYWHLSLRGLPPPPAPPPLW